MLTGLPVFQVFAAKLTHVGSGKQFGKPTAFLTYVAFGTEQKESDSLGKNRQRKRHRPVSVGQVSGEVL